MNIKKYLEVELKYSAQNIKLTDFHNISSIRNPISFVQASGFDHFYSNKKDESAFCRHRIGPDTNQLTFKRKIQDKNNYIRTERNIDLDFSTNVESIRGLCREFGYEYNTSLFKTCFVYKFSDHILVYYICYDIDLQERGRYIEIEAREDFDWKSEDDAWNTICALEKILKSQGLSISANQRIKRSLYEMFKKEK